MHLERETSTNLSPVILHSVFVRKLYSDVAGYHFLTLHALQWQGARGNFRRIFLAHADTSLPCSLEC